MKPAPFADVARTLGGSADLADPDWSRTRWTCIERPPKYRERVPRTVQEKAGISNCQSGRDPYSEKKKKAAAITQPQATSPSCCARAHPRSVIGIPTLAPAQGPQLGLRQCVQGIGFRDHRAPASKDRISRNRDRHDGNCRGLNTQLFLRMPWC